MPSGCRTRRRNWWRGSRRSGTIWPSWRRRRETCARLWKPLLVSRNDKSLNVRDSSEQESKALFPPTSSTRQTLPHLAVGAAEEGGGWVQGKGGGASQPGTGNDGGEGEPEEGAERGGHPGPHHPTQSGLLWFPGEGRCSLVWLPQMSTATINPCPCVCSRLQFCGGPRSLRLSPAATPVTQSRAPCRWTAPRCSAGRRRARSPHQSGDTSSGRQRWERTVQQRMEMIAFVMCVHSLD